ncbi:hypothetical protein OH76DRAFT_1486438 [Lentinus brumalis]|uniref:F-box domain-containing protein n=1 Tax=Lentinus brumalis TaxID=2498619 RepID=A0A371CYB2_9APHY|nr:hypothetical protein OH76DRAFT_1486438 [Polyporus brumalis]
MTLRRPAHLLGWTPGRLRAPLGLPWELLQMVFEYFVLRCGISRHRLRTLLCGNALDMVPLPHVAIRRDILRAVCHDWQVAASANTSLWQDIELAPQVNVEALAEVLLRSGSRPLRIHCYYTTPARSRKPFAAGSGNMSPCMVTSSAAHISAALRTLQNAHQRWESLTLYTNHHLLVNVCLETMFSDTSRCAHVKTLQVVFTGALDLSGSLPRHLHLALPAPMRLECMVPLTSLSLCACRVDWALLAGLLASSLRSLQLAHILNFLPVTEFFDILAASSNLQELHIAGVFMRLDGDVLAEPVPEEKRVALPELRRLCLAALYVSHASHVLRTLHLPRLHELWLDLPYQKTVVPPCDFLDVVALLLESEPAVPLRSLQVLSIRALGFGYAEGKDHIMHTFFATLRDITHIYLDFSCLQAVVWRWLVEACADGYLQALRTLTVSGMSVLDVQEMILMRRQAGHDDIRLYMLFPEDARELRAPRQWLAWVKHNTSLFRAINLAEAHEDLYPSFY